MKKGTNSNSNKKQKKNRKKKKKEEKEGKEEVLGGFEASASLYGQASQSVSSSCLIACFLCERERERERGGWWQR